MDGRHSAPPARGAAERCNIQSSRPLSHSMPYLGFEHQHKLVREDAERRAALDRDSGGVMWLTGNGFAARSRTRRTPSGPPIRSRSSPPRHHETRVPPGVGWLPAAYDRTRVRRSQQHPRYRHRKAKSLHLQAFRDSGGGFQTDISDRVPVRCDSRSYVTFRCSDRGSAGVLQSGGSLVNGIVDVASQIRGHLFHTGVAQQCLLASQGQTSAYLDGQVVVEPALRPQPRRGSFGRSPRTPHPSSGPASSP